MDESTESLVPTRQRFPQSGARVRVHLSCSATVSGSANVSVSGSARLKVRLGVSACVSASVIKIVSMSVSLCASVID